MPFIFEKNILRDDIRENAPKEYFEDDEFQEDLISHNISRGKLLAIVSTAFEVVFVFADIITSILQVNKTFSFYAYLTMYIILIAVNLLYLYLIHGFTQKRLQTKTMIFITAFYMTVIMTWGSVISLLDQTLYGHLMAFMVNMIVCSIIYLMDSKRMSIPYLVSTLILAVGLPFFQRSGNVLVGHYVNLFVFVVISWTASRIVYRNYCDNYVIKKLMHQSEALLEKKIEENKTINIKLAEANAQLKKLTLVDELTGLSNRRSFREYIGRMLQSSKYSNATVSIIMIDVDNFKQYNDSCGHEKGDMALIAVAKQISSMVHSADQIAVRWGGDEFIYAALNKSRADVLKIAETLQTKVSDQKIPNTSPRTGPYITVSLGIGTGAASSGEDIGRIITIADQALYLAKNSGRNCVAALDYNEN